MDAWYRFILSALFPRRKKEMDLNVTEEDDEMMTNYIELDSLMQVIYPTLEDTGQCN